MKQKTKQMLKACIRKVFPACIRKLGRRLVRNYLVHGEFIKRKQVNLIYCKGKNLGDELAPIIYDWMLQRKGINRNQKTKETYKLLTVGSIVGSEICDSVIWGSGVQMISGIENLLNTRKYRKLDVRSVRGPLTLQAIWYSKYHDKKAHESVPFGDPAILMPLIYKNNAIEKKYDVSIILHFSADKNMWKNNQLHYIDILTTDYKYFIDEICSSRKVISSSLHGIILAESYGVPAVFLNTGGHYVEGALNKFYDWYFSTDRWSVKVARSLDEALDMTPMKLPELDEMRKNIINVFPYDLWNEN